MGLRVREWEEARLSSLLSRLPSPGELLVMRLLALWRLGVMGRLRLCLNIVTNVTCHVSLMSRVSRYNDITDGLTLCHLTHSPQSTDQDRVWSLESGRAIRCVLMSVSDA